MCVPFLNGLRCPDNIQEYIWYSDSGDGNVTLKTLNSDINLGSTSLRPPPAYENRVHVSECTCTCKWMYMYMSVNIHMYVYVWIMK